MSTLATAKFNDSDEDDELDGDYKPAEGSSKPKKRSSAAKPKRKRPGDDRDEEGHESDSATDSGSSGSEDEAGEDKDEVRDEKNKLRIEAMEAEAKLRAERAKDLFASMQDEVAVGSIAGSKEVVAGSTGGFRAEEEMVEIKRARKFAGEVIYETVKVHRSDPEAVAYLASLSQPPPSTETPPTEVETHEDQPSTSSLPPNPSDKTAGLSNPAKPPLKAGGPRKKPRQTLEQMAAGLGGAKKMTTLEKSQMDWKSHLSTSTAEADELETHRRTGGYLEKRDFLDRVGDRRMETFEQSRKK